jgi:hypothetical protein
LDSIKRIVRAVVLIFVGAALTACRLDFSVPAKAAIDLSIYQSDQKVGQVALPPGDPIGTAINDWIAAHPDGWSYAFITRPSRVYLHGSNFSVNIQEHEVSVKYCRGRFNCHFFVKANEDLFPFIQNTATLQALPGKK